MSLGGIAKGYAVDARRAVLREEGLTSFFVQAGGDLYIAGRSRTGRRGGQACGTRAARTRTTTSR